MQLMDYLKPKDKPTTVIFTGESKKEYEFEIYAKDHEFEGISAVYIFAKSDGADYDPLYIGESKQLSTRLANHEKKDCAELFDYTNILVMKISGENARKAAEKDLIRNKIPPCNDQLYVGEENI